MFSAARQLLCLPRQGSDRSDRGEVVMGAFFFLLRMYIPSSDKSTATRDKKRYPTFPSIPLQREKMIDIRGKKEGLKAFCIPTVSDQTVQQRVPCADLQKQCENQITPRSRLGFFFLAFRASLTRLPFRNDTVPPPRSRVICRSYSTVVPLLFFSFFVTRRLYRKFAAKRIQPLRRVDN